MSRADTQKPQVEMCQLNESNIIQLSTTHPQENTYKNIIKQENKPQTDVQQIIRSTQSSGCVGLEIVPWTGVQQNFWLRPSEALIKDSSSVDSARFCRSQGGNDHRKYNKSILKRPKKVRHEASTKQVHWGTNTICQTKRTSIFSDKLRKQSYPTGQSNQNAEVEPAITQQPVSQ